MVCGVLVRGRVRGDAGAFVTVPSPAENAATADLAERLEIALTWVPTPHRQPAREALADLLAQAEAGEYMVGWRKRAWKAEADRDAAVRERDRLQEDVDTFKWTIRRANSESARLREALKPFAAERHWQHNYDGAGLVYTGPGANAINADKDIPAAARAALTGEPPIDDETWGLMQGGGKETA